MNAKVDRQVKAIVDSCFDTRVRGTSASLASRQNVLLRKARRTSSLSALVRGGLKKLGPTTCGRLPATAPRLVCDEPGGRHDDWCLGLSCRGASCWIDCTCEDGLGAFLFPSCTQDSIFQVVLPCSLPLASLIVRGTIAACTLRGLLAPWLPWTTYSVHCGCNAVS